MPRISVSDVEVYSEEASAQASSHHTRMVLRVKCAVGAPCTCRCLAWHGSDADLCTGVGDVITSAWCIAVRMQPLFGHGHKFEIYFSCGIGMCMCASPGSKNGLSEPLNDRVLGSCDFAGVLGVILQKLVGCRLPLSLLPKRACEKKPLLRAQSSRLPLQRESTCVME